MNDAEPVPSVDGHSMEEGEVLILSQDVARPLGHDSSKNANPKTIVFLGGNAIVIETGSHESGR